MFFIREGDIPSYHTRALAWGLLFQRGVGFEVSPPNPTSVPALVRLLEKALVLSHRLLTPHPSLFRFTF